jgi:hypothetical protein
VCVCVYIYVGSIFIFCRNKNTLFLLRNKYERILPSQYCDFFFSVKQTIDYQRVLLFAALFEKKKKKKSIRIFFPK